MGYINGGRSPVPILLYELAQRWGLVTGVGGDQESAIFPSESLNLLEQHLPQPHVGRICVSALVPDLPDRKPRNL